MATKTLGVQVSDVVIDEEKGYGSRAEKLVDESQTLVVGSVCKAGPNGRKVALTAPVDEVQTIAITGTMTAGGYTLQFVHPVTGLFINTGIIAYNADLAAVNTALDNALGASQIVATGTVHTAMVLTYSGTIFAGKPHPMVDLDASAAAGIEDTDITRTTAGGQGAQAAVNHVQTITPTGTASAGTFTLTARKYDGTSVTTAAIAYNANAATMTTALNAVLGTDASVITGTIAEIVVTFDGQQYAGRLQDPMVPDFALATGITGYGVAQTTLGHPATEGDPDSVCIAAVTTAGSAITTKAAFITRNARLNQDQLAFGAGNEADAVASLAKLGIVMVRQPFMREQLT